MAELELKNLTKTYPGGVTAVEGANVSIADGEFIVLVGPSGCGKSTILRMIAGLETVSGGEVSIGGQVVNGVEPGERDIAMVFQNYALYPHMSVYDNMAYGLKNQGMKKPEIAARIEEAARMLQLGEYLARKPRQLSGGQRQRVAMGRAIVREPKVFLFDEPLSNLDAKLRTHMRSELKEMHRRLGATFVFVTHDQVEAMSLADRIVIMSAGRVEQVGTPMEIYDRPASTFVAEFIGAPPMNILGTDTALGQAAAGAGNAPSGAAFVGLRPEHMTLAPANGSGMTARVVFREVLGAETVLHLETGEGKRVSLRHMGLADVPDGETVGLGFAPHHLRAFASDGRLIG